MRNGATSEQQEDPDIIRVILDRISTLVPEADGPALASLEQELRTQYGGMRVRIPKRKKHMTPNERDQLIAEAMSSATDAELTDRYGIHRATLYRMVKRGVTERGGK